MRNYIILIVLILLTSCGADKPTLIGGWQFENGGMYWEIYFQPDTVHVFNNELWMIVDVSYEMKDDSLTLVKYGHKILGGEVRHVDTNHFIIDDLVSGESITMSQIPGSQVALRNRSSFKDFLSYFEKRHTKFSAQE